MNTLFEGTSEYYAKYRPPYPPEMFKDVAEQFKLDGTGRLLDVGCGPGVLSLPLSKYFESVLALDIDSGMVEEGRKTAEEEGIQNIEWLNKSADDLDESIGKFKLITFGASFHWINREKFVKLAYNILEDDGGMFICWNGNSLWNKTRSAWEDKVLEVIKKYLGDERRAGNGLFQTSKEKHEDILKEVGFKLMFKNYSTVTQILTADDIIQEQYTHSYSTRSLLGDKVEAFEKELTQELLKINPDNKFEESHIAGSIYAWKN
jgi:ubiquinone/menaquinone biosynthesis C-methylase UbiE